MDITLIINDRDFSSRVSTYQVEQEITYTNIITTLDGTEHFGAPQRRDIITFSLIPYDEDTAQADYEALAATEVIVSYTNPRYNGTVVKNVKVRLDCNIAAIYGLKSVNGKHYYKGGEIVLRRVGVD